VIFPPKFADIEIAGILGWGVKQCELESNPKFERAVTVRCCETERIDLSNSLSTQEPLLMPPPVLS